MLKNSITGFSNALGKTERIKWRNNFIIIVGNISTPLSTTERAIRKKIK